MAEKWRKGGKVADSDISRLISNDHLTESDISVLRETNRIEAKKAKDSLPTSLWDSYSAFANSEGGLILLGVSETPQRDLWVSGVDDAEKLLRDFWNTVNDRSKVSATVLSDQDVSIRHSEHGDFLIINVPQGDKGIHARFHRTRCFQPRKALRHIQT